MSFLHASFASLAAAPATSNRLGVGLHRDASSLAADVDLLFWFIFWICVFFFVLLMGLSAYFVVKYRRRPGVPQQRSASHNTPLELAWSIIPLIILIVIFFWGFDLYMKVHVAPATAEEIDVSAQMWNWSFTYDNGATGLQTRSIADKDVPIFAIPAGRPIKLIMSSQDVIHSLFVPDFRKKLDVFPMRYTTMWFEPMTAGEEHYLFCAEYCGEGHSQMGALLKVLSPSDYLQWKQDNKVADNLPPVELGKILYVTKACNSCHSIDGSQNTGPTWLDLYGKRENVVLPDGSVQEITADENYLRESILVPAAKIVQGYPNQMNSYQGQLTDKELSGLIAYIKSLSEAGRAAMTPEEKGEAPAEGEEQDAEQTDAE